MSGPPATAAQINRPDPPQDRPVTVAEAHRSTGFLLGLVHKLIDFGKQLAATLQQRAPATNRLTVPRYPGTIDIGLILARIACGLQRAAALEARLLRRPPQDEARPAPTNAPSPRQPRAAQPPTRPAVDADPGLARLPTAEEIAAQACHRA